MSAPRDPRAFMFDVDLVKYAQVLTRQRTFIAVFCGAAVLTSLAMTYVFSEMYAAATTIHYRPVDTSLLRHRSSEAFGAPIPSAPFRIISQTLSDVVKSPAIVRPVVEELRLDVEIAPQYDSWYRRWFQESKRWVKSVGKDAMQLLKHGRLIEEPAVERAVKGLSESLNIASTKESYIFVLSVKDQFPDRAAAIVDAAAEQLVRWSREQDQSLAETKSRRLSTEYSGKEVELARLRRERDEILRRNNIVSLAEEVNTGIQSVYSMKLDLERAVSQLNEKRRRLEELRRTIGAREDRYVDPDQLRRLQEERTLAEIDTKALEARRDSARASVDALERRLQAVLAVRKQVDDVAAKIDALTREDTHISDMQLEASEAQRRESEVKILHRAVATATPVQPIKIYHVGLTAFLSLVFSAGLVYVFSYFNIRVFFPSRRPLPTDDPDGRTSDARA